MVSTKRFRLSRVLVGVVVVGGVLAVARPNAVGQAGLDFWNLPSLNREIQETQAADEELDAESLATRRHIQIKDDIVRELTDGEIDLIQAAAHFRNLNAIHMEQLRAAYPGLSDEECVVRNMISYAANSLPRRSESAQKIERLEREFHRLQASRQIHFPT